MTEVGFYPVRRRLKGSYIVLPELLQRIEAFDGNGWCRKLAERVEKSFCADDNLMLAIAVMSDEGKMIGHVVAGLELMLGQATVLVYQFAKDKGADPEPLETNQELQRMIEGWAVSLASAKGIEINHVTIMCKDEKRERLFQKFGYESGPRVMRKEIGNGRNI
jgi:hypothetical protein